jgi:hypothetical protein
MTVMRCIFCKQNSDSCVSVEHIVPESLGNSEHILPKGWVCDSCNNYLAIKVEQPFLDSLFGRNSRFWMQIPNKKGRVPSVIGLYPKLRTKVELFQAGAGKLLVGATNAEDRTKLDDLLEKNPNGNFYVPMADLPDSDYATSRFIAKIGLEILAHRCLINPDWNKDLVEMAELDELRAYVRRGNPKLIWPISIRRIYKQDFLFADAECSGYEVLHEFDILVTDRNEFYAVIAIFGVEFVINLGGPELDGYHNWFKNNQGQSPLYKK